MNPSLEFSQKFVVGYNAACKPLCQELKLPQTAFDILMFLANNPDRRTASDIVEFRHIKANLVSMNVDRLVKEGYLERRAVAGDRRKTELLCTEKARPVIERGRAVQNAFFARLLTNTNSEKRTKQAQETRDALNRILAQQHDLTCWALGMARMMLTKKEHGQLKSPQYNATIVYNAMEDITIIPSGRDELRSAGATDHFKADLSVFDE